MTEKIALLADIHGNLTALEAVLKDAEQKEVTDYWILGDLFLPGPSGLSILTKLKSLSPSCWVRGNWDDCFLAVVDRMIDVNDPSDVYLGILASHILPEFDATSIEFIRNCPLSMRKKVGELTFSLTHHLPDQNYGRTLFPHAEQQAFDTLVTEEIDCAIYAHVHHQLLRYSSEGQLILNPGSIGQAFNFWQPLNRPQQAHYTILEVEENTISDIDFRRIAYDQEKERTRAKESTLPFYSLYDELLETGVTHTHDAELLEEIIQKEKYREHLKKELDSLSYREHL